MAVVSQSFRFLDLPKELRIMVYERLPRQNIHHKIRFSTRANPVSKRVSTETNHVCMVLVLRSVETAILAACRSINREASAIVQSTKQNYVLEWPPRFLYAARSATEIHGCVLLQIARLYNDYCGRRMVRSIPNSILDGIPMWEKTIHGPFIKKFVEQAARALFHQRQNGIAPRIHIILDTTYPEHILPHSDECAIVLDSLCSYIPQLIGPSDIRATVAGFSHSDGWERLNPYAVPYVPEYYEIGDSARFWVGELSPMDEQTWRNEWLE